LRKKKLTITVPHNIPSPRIYVDSHVFTDAALTVSGFACPATPLLETALTPAFTGGELTLD
jgi:hypothetical protein